MTAREAEQKVRERYPQATCRHIARDGGFLGWVIRSYHGPLAERLSETMDAKPDAWKSAARRLTGE
jgi:hypothetical protein